MIIATIRDNAVKPQVGTNGRAYSVLTAVKRDPEANWTYPDGHVWHYRPWKTIMCPKKGITHGEPNRTGDVILCPCGTILSVKPVTRLEDIDTIGQEWDE